MGDQRKLNRLRELFITERMEKTMGRSEVCMRSYSRIYVKKYQIDEIRDLKK